MRRTFSDMHSTLEEQGEINEELIELFASLDEEITIISSAADQETIVKKLIKHNIRYHRLFTRTDLDMHKDQVKLELIADNSDPHDIITYYDDDTECLAYVSQHLDVRCFQVKQDWSIKEWKP